MIKTIVFEVHVILQNDGLMFVLGRKGTNGVQDAGFPKSPRDPEWPTGLGRLLPTAELNRLHNLSCRIETAKIYIVHEWKTRWRAGERKKDDLLAIIARAILSDDAQCKQTKIAPVYWLYQSKTKKTTCRYWILLQVDWISWRKMESLYITTTIILIRPL